MFYADGPQISFHQLVSSILSVKLRPLAHVIFSSQTHFHSCSNLFPEIGCDMFMNEMSKRATTVSLSILVVIEMFNVRRGPFGVSRARPRLISCCTLAGP
jgi:Ca2+ transporting ATPase